MKLISEENQQILEEMNLPLDALQLEKYCNFLYLLQIRTTIAFTNCMEVFWMEERTEAIDDILGEVLQRLEFTYAIRFHLCGSICDEM